MKIQGRVVHYFVLTGTAWIYYAMVLPLLLFIPFYGWGIEEITTWWIVGSPIEFIIAYPLAKILIKVDQKVKPFCDNCGKTKI